MSARTFSMPCLSIVRRPLVLTVRRTHLRSLGTQKRRDCTFGRNVRLVLRCEWETLFPADGRRPVTWQTRDIVELLASAAPEGAAAGRPGRLPPAGTHRRSHVDPSSTGRRPPWSTGCP